MGEKVGGEGFRAEGQARIRGKVRGECFSIADGVDRRRIVPCLNQTMPPRREAAVEIVGARAEVAGNAESLMNTDTLAVDSHSGSVSVNDLKIDTCKGSLLHFLSLAPGPDAEITSRSQVAAFIVAALLFGAGPLAFVALTTHGFWAQSSPEMVFPILRDYQSVWAGFVVIPMLVTFLRSERAVIPQRLMSVRKNVTLRPKKHVNTALWVRRYMVVNILAQLIGLSIGFCMAFIMCGQCMTKPVGGWIVTPEGHMLVAGWMYLVYVGLFWFLCTFYVARAATTVWLLWSVVGSSDVLPHPFHPDRAGGLSQIGKIGLRNQYLLAAVGIQIVFSAWVAKVLGEANPATTPFQVAAIVVSTVSYAMLGPFVFISPLIPFRKGMRDKKIHALRKLGDALQCCLDGIINQLPETPPTPEQEKEITRFKSLMKLVEREPVWPFDTLTLRRFFVAYLAPALAWTLALGPIHDAISKEIEKGGSSPPTLGVPLNGNPTNRSAPTNTSALFRRPLRPATRQGAIEPLRESGPVLTGEAGSKKDGKKDLHEFASALQSPQIHIDG